MCLNVRCVPPVIVLCHPTTACRNVCHGYFTSLELSTNKSSNANGHVCWFIDRPCHWRCCKNQLSTVDILYSGHVKRFWCLIRLVYLAWLYICCASTRSHINHQTLTIFQKRLCAGYLLENVGLQLMSLGVGASSFCTACCVFALLPETHRRRPGERLRGVVGLSHKRSGIHPLTAETIFWLSSLQAPQPAPLCFHIITPRQLSPIFVEV